MRKVGAVRQWIAGALTLAMMTATLPLPAQAAGKQAEERVPMQAVYDKPASTWISEATPMGNGFLGAMVFGGVEEDHIQLNEHTIWSGGPGADPDYDGGMSDQSAEENKKQLQFVREELQKAMTDFTENHSAYVDENGNVITEDYPSTSAAVTAAIESLKGEKDQFGRYQTMGDIYIGNTAGTFLVGTESNSLATNGAQFPEKLFDGDINTKWYSTAGTPSGTVQPDPAWVTAEYSQPRAITGYTITAGEDMPVRDPKAWNLYGSEDGKEFVLLDHQENIQFTERRQEKSFQLEKTSAPYRFFKIEITELWGGNWGAGVQMSELTFHEEDTEPEEPVSNYRRVLDLDNGIATVSYEQNGIGYQREYFVSYPGNFMAIRLTADQKGTLSRVIRFESPQTKITVSAEGDTLTVTGSPADQLEDGLKFAGQLKVVLPGDGTVTAKDSQLWVDDADEILLYWSAGTNYQQCMDDTFDYFSDEDPLIAVSQRVESAAKQSYEDLKKTHQEDYQELFSRVTLNFGGAQMPDKTTPELLAGFKDGTNTELEDRYLETLYFQFGRYLLIASSREGSLPANLQGIWTNELTPPWDADYHTNINVQMNYWPAETTNLAECHMPMIDYINSLVPRGEITAQRYHCTEDGGDVRGWTTYHENNIWGNTAPAVSSAFYFPAGAAWICQDIWEYYAFTQDEEFLKENFDTLMGASLFWVDNLVTDTRDGTLVSSPSWSPEHGPYSLGATCDQAIIWDLFDNTLAAAEVLGLESSEIEEIRTAQSKLSGPKIGLNGQFQEWKDEITIDVTGDNGHRHINHLFMVAPGHQVVPGRSEQDDAYAKAMEVTLDTRGNYNGGIGWTSGWKLNVSARLLDGDRAYNMFQQLLADTTYDNLFDRLWGYFQIEGNFGGTAGVAEMLLQSQAGFLRPIPALPEQWPSGSYSGLCARGGFEVDAQWDQWNLEEMTIRSKSGNDCEIKYPNLDGAVVTCDGRKVDYERLDQDTIRFATEAGAEYEITEIPTTLPAPGGLSAQRKDARQVQLSWQPVSGAEMYHVYRQVNGGEWELAAYGVLDAQYVDQTAVLLDGNDSFVYRVTAVDADGKESEPSDPAEPEGIRQPVVDGNDSKVHYSDGWSHSAEGGYYGGGINWTDKVGQTAEFTFQGTGIELYTSTKENMNAAWISVDDGEPQQCSMYSPSREDDVCVFRVDDLENGTHTIRIATVDEMVTEGGTLTISIDYFKVLNRDMPTAESVTVSSVTGVTLLEQCGQRIQLAAQVLPQEADSAVAWSLAGDTGLASIDQNGVLTAGEEPGVGTVQVYATALDGSGVQGMLEVQIATDADAALRTNLLSNKAFTLVNNEPIYSGYGPEYLTDGYIGSEGTDPKRLALQVGQTSVTLEVDLGETVRLGTLYLYEFSKDGVRVNEVQVQIPDGADGWTTVGTVAEPEMLPVNAGACLWRVTFPDAVETQKLRVVCSDPEGQGMSVWEIEAYGPDAEMQQADKSALLTALDKAAWYRESDFDADGWEAFQTARDEAIEVVNDLRASQETVDAVTEALNAIMESVPVQPQLTGIVLKVPSEVLPAGRTMPVQVQAVYDRKPAEDVTAQAELALVQDGEIAAFNDDGTITGQHAGTATLTASYEDWKTELTLEVVENPVGNLTVTCTDGGRVERSPAPPYYVGQEVVLTAVPDDGYVFDHWNIGSETEISSELTVCVGDAEMIEAVFSPRHSGGRERYLIQAEQSAGGRISPAGRTVAAGSSATFTITPDDGYAIADVLVDGKSVGAVETYTFENVSAKHTITAKFTKGGETDRPVAGFNDVHTTDWFADAVEYVVDAGLMNGTSATTFSPKGDTTRGMIVTILYRLAGSPEVESDGATWWSDARVWAMENGISDGTNMEGKITREQLAAMLYRYAGSEAVKGDLSAFTDASSVSDWAVDALIWATEEGIVTGKTGNVLDPNAGATRAETATMLMRFSALDA